jgi:hemoglobin/transferrin/lactoferrin receptor protein
VGAFAQHALPLADGRLRLLPGARYAYNRAEARRVQHPVTGEATRVSGSWDTVVGSLRAVWTADEAETLHVFAGVSQGYRAPNLSDLTRFDIARSDELETPVADLDPERFLSFEAGVKWRAEPVSLQATAYRTHIRDLIVRAPTGRVMDDGLREVTKRNAGDGHVQGVELAGVWQLHDDWALRGVASWMEGKVESYPDRVDRRKREPLSRVMPLTAELALRWAPRDSRWWTEVAVRSADKADQLSASDRSDTQRIPPGGTPGYVVWIARGGVQITSDLACSLAVENVADEDYRIHGSGVNEPGRNIVLALDARF